MRRAPELLEVPRGAITEAPASARFGVSFGIAAVIFWSFGSSLVYFGARKSGTWPFVAVAALTGGALQVVFRMAWSGELRSVFRLPWRLWSVPLPCFVVYGLAWPWALALSSPRQVVAVNLINYLWPVLTVILSAWCVPGVRLTRRTAVALTLALAGLVVANFKALHNLMLTEGTPSAGPQWLPYGLALIAAFTWAIYSAVLVRWRAWANGYVTSPVGFLLIGIIAALLSAVSQTQANPFSASGAFFTVLYGAGPLAAGYLLWEVALPKARVQTLSLIAAATPVLSTALLCCFLQTKPGADLMAAALLVGGGVLLSASPRA